MLPRVTDVIIVVRSTGRESPERVTQKGKMTSLPSKNEAQLEPIRHSVRTRQLFLFGSAARVLVQAWRHWENIRLPIAGREMSSPALSVKLTTVTAFCTQRTTLDLCVDFIRT